MAGVLKVRDTDGTLRTITAVKVRDTDGTLRTLSFIKIRDTDGTLREVFTSGGGGTPNPAYINPGYDSLTGTAGYKTTTATGYSTAAAPSSYAWGVLLGPGAIASGSTSAMATLAIYGSPDETVTAVFYCDMVISGVTYRATCSVDYYQYSGGGGGPLP